MSGGFGLFLPRWQDLAGFVANMAAWALFVLSLAILRRLGEE